VRAGYRLLRVSRPVTRLLGPQYRRSRDLLEVDITYACNLKCENCNRSCRQAPSSERMSIEQIEALVAASEQAGKHWRRVRVLGGEPTLHPELLPILTLLQERLGSRGTLVELVTNGFGPAARRVLGALPAGVEVDDSRKSTARQPFFGPFNLAPVDTRRHAFSSYRNGCWIAAVCGMGLTPHGYYCCALAGGIDRVVGLGLGRLDLPEDDDDLLDQAEAFCGLCGRFHDGHFVPRNLRRPLVGEVISPTWRDLYARYHDHPPALPWYASAAPGPGRRR